VVDIDNRQLEKLLADGVPLIDVRTPEEWRQTGVVEGSHTLMFFDSVGRYDAKRWIDRLGTIATSEEPVILICRTGNRTSAIAGFLDRQVGYEMVFNVRRGISQWIAEGRPTHKH
jgi:rhodanese-related sulfurtransferase